MSGRAELPFEDMTEVRNLADRLYAFGLKKAAKETEAILDYEYYIGENIRCLYRIWEAVTAYSQEKINRNNFDRVIFEEYEKNLWSEEFTIEYLYNEISRIRESIIEVIGKCQLCASGSCAAHEKLARIIEYDNEKLVKNIPSNIEEALIFLDDNLKDDDKFYIKNKPNDSHMGLGLWMRNNWGLWKGSRLKSFFNDLKIFHSDDMSAIIIESYHRKLNNKPLDIEDQIKEYHNFWRNNGVVDPTKDFMG